MDKMCGLDLQRTSNCKSSADFKEQLSFCLEDCCGEGAVLLVWSLFFFAGMFLA